MSRKLERSVDNINQATCDFEEYEDLDNMSREYLLDEIIDVMEDLIKRDTTDGRFYTEKTHIVKQGEVIPQPFTTIKTISCLSDEPYEIDIKTITGLRWNDSGDLIIDYLGYKN